MDRRTVALHLSVEELGRARERVATARTKAAADATIAEGGGFLASPRAALEHARDAERAAERAAELAAGHGAVRLVGVIAIDAIDVLALEVAVARLVADGAGAGIRLRRCDSDHRRGVLSTCQSGAFRDARAARRARPAADDPTRRCERERSAAARRLLRAAMPARG
jgi:hypothetical protein